MISKSFNSKKALEEMSFMKPHSKTLMHIPRDTISHINTAEDDDLNSTINS